MLESGRGDEHVFKGTAETGQWNHTVHDRWEQLREKDDRLKEKDDRLKEQGDRLKQQRIMLALTEDREELNNYSRQLCEGWFARRQCLT